MDNYWIKRVEELIFINRKLELKNERLFDLVSRYAPHCGHYDGSRCVNIIGNNYKQDCDCPWENDCYETGD